MIENSRERDRKLGERTTMDHGNSSDPLALFGSERGSRWDFIVYPITELPPSFC